MRSSLRSLESVEPEMITEIDAPNFGIGAELFGATFPEYFPTFQDVCVIGYAKSFADVMIGNQHANPRLSQIPDNFLEVLYRKRVDPRKRFVKKNKRRLQREGTGNFEPAAFTARKCVGFTHPDRFEPHLHENSSSRSRCCSGVSGRVSSTASKFSSLVSCRNTEGSWG